MDEPGWRVWDLNIYKSTPLTERTALEFRFELYNMWNTPHLQRPNRSVGVAAFGQLTAQPDIGSGSPRSIQFGMKLLW